MTKVKQGDFVEVEYTGRTKEDELVFDTTDEKLAKEANIYSKNMTYGPVVVCIGEGQLLPGLENYAVGKETGKECKVELPPETAFGKKDTSLIRMISANTFKKQGIEPQPGMQVNVDGLTGIIKTASGGRCMVDFNHPLSGKDLVYTLKINKIVADAKEKVKSFITLALNVKDPKVEIKDSKVEITLKKELPKDITTKLAERMKSLIPEIKEYTFNAEKPAKDSK